MHKFLTFLYKFIKFLSKAFRFIFRYIVKDPIFVFKYFVAFFQKDYTPQVKFYNTEEFMTEIKSGKSYIRIGDGEIGLLHHRDIHYQKAGPLLISKLTEIIENYGKEKNNSNENEKFINKNESNYILSIPIFVNISNKDLENTKGKLSCWLPLKVEFFRRFNRSAKYFDAHTFYRKGFFESNMYEYLKDKKLIINTTAENIKNQKENIEKRFEVIGWLEAISPNPFDRYEYTKNEIQNVINQEIAKSKSSEERENIKRNIVLILGSGPMSKVLAYDFAKQGIQGIDIGKGFEQLYNERNYEHEI